MLRPSASVANASALAAASMLPSLPLRSGKTIAASNMTARPMRRDTASPKRSVSGATRLRRSVAIGDLSGFAGRGAPEQPGGPKHEHQHQDRKDDHVGPPHRNKLSAEGLDEADDQSAQHGARNIADAAEH